MQRKATIPDSDRTAQRDDAAEKIQELMDQGRFSSMSKQEVADYAGYSRQHITNVLELYFDENAEPKIQSSDTVANWLEQQPVPSDVDGESYLRGYANGYTDAIIKRFSK